ncbi:MAG: hypothetical protein A4E32_00921 [Methanomassiliicoccales archaeon PtaU1.Bin124]|nr:MAG: hypothetical protein A4E32_00921 [Methanomassiliicoccales archaeon PtaU1.Bin124]
MSPAENIVLLLVLCGLLSILSYRLGLLSRSGSFAALWVGVLIGIFGSFLWLIVLLVFTVAGFAATRYKFDLKEKKGLQEGKKGERTWKNVVANGLVPLVIAIIFYAAGQQDSDLARLTYITAIAVAASDTIASEMGVISAKVYLITTFKRVEPGVDGGISAYGTAWALFGSIFASLLGWVLLFPGMMFDARILVPLVLGFVGCNIDSLIGATLETWGYVDKLGNNISSMAISSIIGYAILLTV